MNTGFLGPAVATAPTVYGIETIRKEYSNKENLIVATAPTVYGIETIVSFSWLFYCLCCNSTYRLRY